MITNGLICSSIPGIVADKMVNASASRLAITPTISPNLFIIELNKVKGLKKREISLPPFLVKTKDCSACTASPLDGIYQNLDMDLVYALLYAFDMMLIDQLIT